MKDKDKPTSDEVVNKKAVKKKTAKKEKWQHKFLAYKYLHFILSTKHAEACFFIGAFFEKNAGVNLLLLLALRPPYKYSWDEG